MLTTESTFKFQGEETPTRVFQTEEPKTLEQLEKELDEVFINHNQIRVKNYNPSEFKVSEKIICYENVTVKMYDDNGKLKNIISPEISYLRDFGGFIQALNKVGEEVFAIRKTNPNLISFHGMVVAQNVLSHRIKKATNKQYAKSCEVNANKKAKIRKAKKERKIANFVPTTPIISTTIKRWYIDNFILDLRLLTDRSYISFIKPELTFNELFKLMQAGSNVNQCLFTGDVKSDFIREKIIKAIADLLKMSLDEFKEEYHHELN